MERNRKNYERPIMSVVRFEMEQYILLTGSPAETNVKVNSWGNGGNLGSGEASAPAQRNGWSEGGLWE